MQIATPNSTFRPRDEEGDGVLDVVGDFALPLFFLLFVSLLVTATAIRAGAGAVVLLFGPLLAFKTLPEYGL